MPQALPQETQLAQLRPHLSSTGQQRPTMALAFSLTTSIGTLAQVE